jgi:prepilin-type N-terminal cleavage/methylation domain-containing protein/prepilin-type processing-associated H-X9-DG protein
MVRIIRMNKAYVTRRAFTLIELLVVIGIIGILAAVILPVYMRVRDKGRQTACVANERQITMAVLQYVQDNDESFCWSNSFDNGRYWEASIDPYIGAKAGSNGTPPIWHCPSSSTKSQSYSANPQVIGLIDTHEKPPLPPAFDSVMALPAIANPAEIVLLGEGLSVDPDPDTSRKGLDGRAADEFAYPHPALRKDHTDDGTWAASWLGLAWNNKQISWLHSGGANFSYCDGHTKFSARGTLKDSNWDVRCRYGQVCKGAASSPIYPAPDGTCGDQSPINCQ